MKPMYIDKWLESRKARINGRSKQVEFVQDLIESIILNGEHSVMVVGEHKSKGITLPVYHFSTPVAKVWMRNNFCNWNIAIEAKNGIYVPEEYVLEFLILSGATAKCEGMEDKLDWDTYETGCKRFVAYVSTDAQLFALLWAILHLNMSSDFAGAAPKEEVKGPDIPDIPDWLDTWLDTVPQGWDAYRRDILFAIADYIFDNDNDGDPPEYGHAQEIFVELLTKSDKTFYEPTMALVCDDVYFVECNTLQWIVKGHDADDLVVTPVRNN